MEQRLLTHNMPNAVYERIETLLVTRKPAKYRLENINKTVILTQRQYLAMNGIEITNLLSLPCAYCQRWQTYDDSAPKNLLMILKRN